MYDRTNIPKAQSVCVRLCCGESVVWSLAGHQSGRISIMECGVWTINTLNTISLCAGNFTTLTTFSQKLSIPSCFDETHKSRKEATLGQSRSSNQFKRQTFQKSKLIFAILVSLQSCFN